jgi:hypothetical protein
VGGRIGLDLLRACWTLHVACCCALGAGEWSRWLPVLAQAPAISCDLPPALHHACCQPQHLAHSPQPTLTPTTHPPALRCRKWAASGGKSNAYFAKTRDDRFIVKSLSKAEKASFLDFAPAYFEYLATKMGAQASTCLAKVLGVYNVALKSSGGGERGGQGPWKDGSIDVLVGGCRGGAVLVQHVRWRAVCREGGAVAAGAGGAAAGKQQ